MKTEVIHKHQPLPPAPAQPALPPPIDVKSAPKPKVDVDGVPANRAGVARDARKLIQTLATNYADAVAAAKAAGQEPPDFEATQGELATAIARFAVTGQP
jgi:hypothetical protein